MRKHTECTILFDLDGTLIDSTEAILSSFADTFRDFGDPAPPSGEIEMLIGHPLTYMFAHLGVPRKSVARYVERYKSHYRVRSKPMTRLLPGAKEAIEEASSFARLGIVTTKTGLYSRILLEHMGVMHHFEVLIGSEDVVHPKPHPEPILKALHRMGIGSSKNVWMVGDTCLDMKSAADAGILAVGVLSGYADASSLRKCTHFIRKTSHEAIQFIKHFNKAEVKRD